MSSDDEEDRHRKCLAFVAECLALEGHQTVTKIQLTYTPKAEFARETLRTWSHESDSEYFAKEGREVLAARLATDIMEIAENHASSFGTGRHRFVLRAFQHLGERRTHAFTVKPTYHHEDQALVSTDGSIGGDAGEMAPTATGMVSQLMRHLENRDRQSASERQAMLQAMGHFAAQLREENRELRDALAQRDQERRQWMQEVEAARSEEHRREIEAQTTISREARRDLATKKIVNLLPVAVSAWARSKEGAAKASNGGKPAPKIEQSPIAKAAKIIAYSLTDDQRGKLRSVLTIEQQAMLAEILEIVRTPDGDSPLVATIANDLIASLSQPQLAALMGIFTLDQQRYFVQVMQMARAGAQMADDRADVVTGAVAFMQGTRGANGANGATHGSADGDGNENAESNTTEES